MVDTPWDFCFFEAVKKQGFFRFSEKRIVGFLLLLVQDAVDVGGKSPFSFQHGGAPGTITDDLDHFQSRPSVGVFP